MMDIGMAASTDDVIQVTDDTFVAEVIEASKIKPVIVDFWAPWCGPCKALGPELEAAVAETGGKVRLVKVNVDENQVYAAQLQVRSIPAVFAFANGHPFDGFMGNLAPSRIREFIKRLLTENDPEVLNVREAIEAANEMLEHGNPMDAMDIYTRLLEQDPECLPAIGGMIAARVKVGQVDAARQMIHMVPEAKRGEQDIAAAIAKIEVAEAASKASGKLESQQALVAAEPDNHQARLDLALARLAEGDRQGAVDELLELFRRDREWQDGAAKTQLFKLFESFGPKDPVTLSGRRRLSSMIFV